MDKRLISGAAIAFAMLSGCASIDFSSDEESALKYYEGAPFLHVTTNTDCSKTTQVLMIPLKEKRLKISPGVFGSSSMTVKLVNGMVSEVGQTTDTKVPEVSKGLGELWGMAMLQGANIDPEKTCTAGVKVFRIESDATLTPVFPDLR